MSAAAAHLLALVRSSTRVLLTGPEGPDGDSIGACLALQRVLAVAAPGVRVDVAGTPAHRYTFLPGAAAMIADRRVGRAEGVVVLDGDRRRLPTGVTEAFDEARWTGIIDHHRSTDLSPYTVSVFDPAAESTCGMVAELADAWGVPFDADLATLLYVGVIFDTGGFRYSNTQPSTHRLAARLIEAGIDHAQLNLRILMERRPQALRLLSTVLSGTEFLADGRVAFATCPRSLLKALDAHESDLEGVVDLLQHTEGVDLAVVVVEKTHARVKLSLRSRGRVDVAALARSLHDGGGGHAKAAGVVVEGPWDEVVPVVKARVVAGAA